jgi:hypothetical protein
MGGSSGTQTTTTNSQPWKPQQPLIKYGMKQAKDLYKQPGPEYYPNSTVAGFAPEQEQAFTQGAARATNGNATMKMGESYTQDVLGGKYLNNPYNDQVYNSIAQKVMPSVNSMFSAGGRYGSQAHQGNMVNQLTSAYAPYASQNYQQGLDRMGQAANASQMFGNEDYRNLAALESIGKQRQDLSQKETDDAVSRWNYGRDLPGNKLSQFMGFVGGNYGNRTTSAVPYNRPSMFSQIAGGGLGLLGLLG